MYSDEQITEALASNNKEVLETLAVYILLESQNLEFDSRDIKPVPQDDPRRLDVIYKDCNFQIKEIMNLQQDCLLENYNGDKGEWDKLNIEIYRRSDIYKRILKGERSIGEVVDGVFFDLGLAIKKEVESAITTYSDISIRKNMDLFLFVTQPRIFYGSTDQVKQQVQDSGFRSIFALIYDKKFINILQTKNSPSIIKQFIE
ncbi:hypothetical protein SDA22_10105 [Legionella pneumophila serogroup 1]|uniref:hypothetical protein n=1 Tax=Legionella pneumophila TaxID=446 RepID=UPI000770B5C8|nr:hypothetical protein [Legionella pneumophila]CZH38838.1 Uncharacterised protein [Legionella pneumophila]HAT1982587.1 hypothetical protein [Legionella pneumophila]HAT4424912.1 hypothetical protein [Legionella pneumophila]HAU1720825.1 hypothetical protein [Legionella pneumophila]HAU2287403.1 hypothetical protein [Legionella pneumophila]